MSEFAYLTGRKELFAEAPPEAMVVLETEAGEPRILYAVAHEMGAAYWEADGMPGRQTGLIGLFHKTRVVASRARADGSKPAGPKRDPIPNARMQRMKAAQASASKAAGGLHSGMNAKPAPAPAKPAKAAAEPAAPAMPRPLTISETVQKLNESRCPDCGNTGLHACTGKPVTPGTVKIYSDNTELRVMGSGELTKATAGGFVSLFAMSKAVGGTTPQGTFVTLHQSGNLTFSRQLMAQGDVVDIQLDLVRQLIRVGKVEKGGRLLKKGKVLGCTPLLKLVKIPEGEKSIRIYLAEADGWWQGEYPKA